jgi:hypothetical protein
MTPMIATIYQLEGARLKLVEEPMSVGTIPGVHRPMGMFACMDGRGQIVTHLLQVDEQTVVLMQVL